MPLDRLLHQVYFRPWAILPSKHETIQRLIEAHLAGVSFPSLDVEEQPPYEVVGNTAIVPVEGVILPKASGLEAMCGAFSLESFKAALSELQALPNVSNVILNFDSGGGTVGGVVEAAAAVAKLGQAKDLYAYIGPGCVCASAAYWLASPATILASPSAEIGSIGVYCAILTMADALEKQGVTAEIFQAGKYKTLGIAARDMTDDERAIVQAGVDKAYLQFTSQVRMQRPGIPTNAMQGLVYEADDAQKLGLIDGMADSLDGLIGCLNAA